MCPCLRDLDGDKQSTTYALQRTKARPFSRCHVVQNSQNDPQRAFRMHVSSIGLCTVDTGINLRKQANRSTWSEGATREASPPIDKLHEERAFTREEHSQQAGCQHLRAVGCDMTAQRYERLPLNVAPEPR